MSAAVAAVDDEVVQTIVDQVWESLLAAPAVPWSGPYDGPVTGATALSAEVALTGDWNGVVRLRCDHATARSLARAMLAVEPDADLPAADVADAVGEVVNVVGGNVKGTLPGTTALGLPRIGEADLSPDTGLTTRCLVDWAGALVLIEVVADPHLGGRAGAGAAAARTRSRSTQENDATDEGLTWTS